MANAITEFEDAILWEIQLPGHPFAAVAAPDGRRVFVSLSAHAESGVAILQLEDQSAKLVGVVRLDHDALGMALSSDGALLAVADFRGGVSFLELESAAEQRPRLLGHVETGNDMGTFHVRFSADDRLLFASEEKRAAVSVIDVRRAREQEFAKDAVTGQVPVDHAPVGMALSPSGRHVYVVSEATEVTPNTDPIDVHDSPFAGKPLSRLGAINVIDVSRASSQPETAVVGRAMLGKNPVRVALSRGGRVAWVTSRASDELLAIDTERLIESPEQCVLARVPVGASPVGVALVGEDSIAVVANSNRFAARGVPQTLALVDTQAALSNRDAAVFGVLNAGVFPREFALSPDRRTLMVTNFGSDSVMGLSVAALRRGPLDFQAASP